MTGKRELRLAVWQFVRVMVELENSKSSALLYKYWEKTWVEVDKQLDRLSNEDHRAYADLMMNQEVVLKVEKARFWSEISIIVLAVIKNIDRELKSIKQIDPRKADLIFERRELSHLSRYIAGKKKALKG